MTVPCPRCGTPAIHDVVVVLAGPDDIGRGLLGWASAIVGSFRIDGIAIRATEAGDLRITMPARKDGTGRLHAIVMPVEPVLLRRVEAAVIEAYLHARRGGGREVLR